MSYREPRYLLELVASLCALPLVVAYRIEGGAIGAPETLAWLALGWSTLGAARSWWGLEHGPGGTKASCLMS
jgi:hypothetical protein